MTQHACFRISSSSTSVNETAAFTRLLSLNLFVDNFLFDIFAQCHEIFPYEKPLIFNFIWKLIKCIDHDSLNIGQSMQIDFVFLELLYAVDYNKLGFRMISLIEAGFSVVCWVNSTDDTVGCHTALECNNPLRCVVTHDIHRFALLDTYSMHCFCESIGVLQVLIPGP
jgi:hypothetical protein